MSIMIMISHVRATGNVTVSISGMMRILFLLSNTGIYINHRSLKKSIEIALQTYILFGILSGVLF